LRIGDVPTEWYQRYFETALRLNAPLADVELMGGIVPPKGGAPLWEGRWDWN